MDVNTFPLPGTGFHQLENILKAYSSKDDHVSPEYIVSVSKIHKSDVTKNDKFFVECGILKISGSKKKLTSLGKKLGEALNLNQKGNITKYWREAIKKVEFFQTLLVAIQKQSPIKLQDLRKTIYSIAGKKVIKETTKLSIKTKTVIDILESAEYIRLEYRGKYKYYSYLSYRSTQSETEHSDTLFRLLHPYIIKNAYKQLLNGYYRDAILNSFVAVFDLIRQRTKLDIDGVPLAQAVFSLSSPKLIISTLDTESGRNEQLGFMKLLEGAYTSIRNPKAHSLLDNSDELVTAQYLIFASLLVKRIENAKTPSKDDKK